MNVQSLQWDNHINLILKQKCLGLLKSNTLIMMLLWITRLQHNKIFSILVLARHCKYTSYVWQNIVNWQHLKYFLAFSFHNSCEKPYYISTLMRLNVITVEGPVKFRFWKKVIWGPCREDGWRVPFWNCCKNQKNNVILIINAFTFHLPFTFIILNIIKTIFIIQGSKTNFAPSK